MEGMRNMTNEEMNTVTGGYCTSKYGGYFFCCPANADIMVENIMKYDKTNHDKASKYIQFCYEACGYTG